MKRDLTSEIGIRLRDKRESNGLTQEQLADLAKTHRTYVGMVERGEKRISVEGLDRLTRALDTTLSEFLEGL